MLPLATLLLWASLNVPSPLVGERDRVRGQSSESSFRALEVLDALNNPLTPARSPTRGEGGAGRRVPLRVGRIDPPAAPAERWHLEVGSFAGVMFGHDARLLGPSVGAELAWAPRQSGPLAQIALAWSGAAPVFNAARTTRASGWQLGLAPGAALRQPLGSLVLEVFVATPVSVLWPVDAHADALGGRISPALLLGLQAGARLAVWEEGRYSMFLRAVADVPVVNSGSLHVAPVSFSAGAGIAWSGA